MLLERLMEGVELLKLKNILQRNATVWSLSRATYRWVTPITKHPIRCWLEFYRLFVDWSRYRSAGGKALLRDFYPCLDDRTGETKFDPQYFYQAAWAMSAIYKADPTTHIDVGSDVRFVGMLTAITKVKFVDIRPLNAALKNLECLNGTILNLPFDDQSLESLSTLHVIEHIGLGRYGDPIDPLGAEKASTELKRVLSVGGSLYISMPIGRPRVQFNGHRTFSPQEVLMLFEGLTLTNAALVDNYGHYHSDVNLNTVIFNETLGNEFALGCFVFKREVNEL